MYYSSTRRLPAAGMRAGGLEGRAVLGISLYTGELRTPTFSMMKGKEGECFGPSRHKQTLTPTAHLKCCEQFVNGFAALLVYGMVPSFCCSCLVLGRQWIFTSKGVLRLVVIPQSAVTLSPASPGSRRGCVKLASALGSALHALCLLHCADRRNWNKAVFILLPLLLTWHRSDNKVHTQPHWTV